jgi:hypothetical protein
LWTLHLAAKKNMHVQRDQKMTHLEMLKRKSLPNGDMKLGSPVVDLPMGNAKKIIDSAHLRKIIDFVGSTRLVYA